MPGGCYPKFRNDRGIPEICIGVREFECIGESPSQDHPHVYINMGETGTILCPYCGTRFRFDSRLTPLNAEPPDSLFADQTRPDTAKGRVGGLLVPEGVTVPPDIGRDIDWSLAGTGARHGSAVDLARLSAEGAGVALAGSGQLTQGGSFQGLVHP
jgi:uncharacterized Zn-finger protein